MQSPLTEHAPVVVHFDCDMVGAAVVGALVLGAAVVGTLVVGAAVFGALVIGALGDDDEPFTQIFQPFRVSE